MWIALKRAGVLVIIFLINFIGRKRQLNPAEYTYHEKHSKYQTSFQDYTLLVFELLFLIIPCSIHHFLQLKELFQKIKFLSFLFFKFFLNFNINITWKTVYLYRTSAGISPLTIKKNMFKPELFLSNEFKWKSEGTDT